LRKLAYGKFNAVELGNKLEVDADIVRTVAHSMGFKFYAESNCYVFAPEDFSRPVLTIEELEAENAALKGQLSKIADENKRLKALIRTADSDHEETIQKYEKLSLYVAAARDILSSGIYLSLDEARGMIISLRHLLTIGSESPYVPRFLMQAVQPPAAIPPEEYYDDDDDYDDDDNYDIETDWYN
jgi:hypothetical protein